MQMLGVRNELLSNEKKSHEQEIKSGPYIYRARREQQATLTVSEEIFEYFKAVYDPFVYIYMCPQMPLRVDKGCMYDTGSHCYPSILSDHRLSVSDRGQQTQVPTTCPAYTYFSFSLHIFHCLNIPYCIISCTSKNAFPPRYNCATLYT